MRPLLARYEVPLYSLLRIVSGLLFAMHGTQKLFGSPGDGTTVPLASFMGIAGIIELVGGLMVALGLFTSVAAFICSGEMAVAYFKAHAPAGPIPLLNRGELATLYCFLFFYISARGSGVAALDRLLGRTPVQRPVV